MKTLLGALAFILILVAAHAIPELLIAIVPAWILVLSIFAGIIALARLAIWSFAQAMRGDR